MERRAQYGWGVPKRSQKESSSLRKGLKRWGDSEIFKGTFKLLCCVISSVKPPPPLPYKRFPPIICSVVLLQEGILVGKWTRMDLCIQVG